MPNSDEITLPLTEDIAEEDAPPTQPLLSELLADIRALAQRFDAAQLVAVAFQAEVRARWVADDAFQAEVRERLEHLETEHHATNEHLGRIDGQLEHFNDKLDLLGNDIIDQRTHIARLRKRVDQLEQAA
jgi:predicted nuclease with TOPRIM domain